MIIERSGNLSVLKFKELRNGEAFRQTNNNVDLVFIKGHQFRGVGDCATNLSNGSVSTFEKDLEVVRLDAKIVI